MGTFSHKALCNVGQILKTSQLNLLEFVKFKLQLHTKICRIIRANFLLKKEFPVTKEVTLISYIHLWPVQN